MVNGAPSGALVNGAPSDAEARTVGRATEAGTQRFAARVAEQTAKQPFNRIDGLAASSLGLGTYLGAPDEATDASVIAAARACMRGGVNVLDTAINYRHMRGERAIGVALREAIAAGEVARDEIIVCTKGGFLPFDGGMPKSPKAYLRAAYVDSGVARAEDIVADCHCISPTFVEAQLERSRANLGLETLDVYYLHNPETQLESVSRMELARRVKAAFEVLERARADGRIARYGFATWQAFRATEGAPEHLSLEVAVGWAREVGGEGHGFRVVQLPYNLSMAEAWALTTQKVNGREATLLDTAAALDVSVVASAPLYQARLTKALPPSVRKALGGASDAHRALSFARSTPGIACALVGMKDAAHVQENLQLLAMPRLSTKVIASLFKKGVPPSGATTP